MLENRKLVEQTIKMYDELKKMKAYVSKLENNEVVTDEETKEIFLLTDWKFIPGIKDTRYLELYLATLSKEDFGLLVHDILAELDEALKLFNADEIERLRNKN